MVLSPRFSNLFAISINVETKVADYATEVAGRVVWQPVSQRNFQYWELAKVNVLLLLLPEIGPMGRVVDSIRWRKHGSGLFLLRLFYRALSGVVVEEFLGGVVWQLKNLRKVD